MTDGDIMTKKEFIWSIDVSTRAKRKLATSLAIELLNYIRNAEEASMERMPLNLWGTEAYENAEESVGAVNEAIGQLIEAY